MHRKYERKMEVLRDELELRRKVEIKEVEERKNAQIHTLMQNHEKAFGDIKNYYNDITLNNMALINSLKEQVEEMKTKGDRDEKLMTEIKAENKSLVEPLKKARGELEELEKQLESYTRDKKFLASTRARLKVAEETIKQHEWRHEVLEQRFGKVQAERDELYDKFVKTIYDVQQKSGFKNLVLEKKLGALEDQLEKKEAQLNEVRLAAFSFRRTPLICLRLPIHACDCLDAPLTRAPDRRALNRFAHPATNFSLFFPRIRCCEHRTSIRPRWLSSLESSRTFSTPRTPQSRTCSTSSPVRARRTTT
jgi:septal ring factor EnvC (AmiA/AmiB activator)